MRYDENLFLAFRNRWSLDRVKAMSLEEYTGIGENRDDFTYWIENKLEDLGSIWGGSSFKFIIYKRKDKNEKESDARYTYGEDYAWLTKYGNNPQEVFEKVKNLIIKVIELSEANRLDEIDKIKDLGHSYKWKIAFHYQKLENMKIVNIFSEKVLQKIAKGENLGSNLNNVLNTAQIYQKLLADKQYTLETMMKKAADLWDNYKESKEELEQEKNKETQNLADDNADRTDFTQNSSPSPKIPLNQILYGPPGTGKTYSTIDKALEILLDEKYKNALEPTQRKDIAEILNKLKENPSDKENRKKAKEKFDKFKEQGQIEFITFHQSFSYEEFVEGIKPIFIDENGKEVKNSKNMVYKVKDGIFKQICERAKDNKNKPYILIIDEINRGNISKILGELITLIERSKRIGKSEELRTTLPYSNELFGVPKNLYIIGTMNTADRSIALLDTALRRRFDFTEMMPDCEKLKQIWLVQLDKYIDDKKNAEAEILYKILKSINNRIEFLLDREHTIGHSFFFEKAKVVGDNKYELSLEDLQGIFAKKIIPLLQEYFYEDYAKIDAVLNGNGMIKAYTMGELDVNLGNDFVESDKKIYKITESSKWNENTFLAIYK